jgi:hypothetical protein
MNKAEIIKGLSEIQHSLHQSKTMLIDILNDPIWDMSVSGELDEVVSIKQKIDKHINDLVDIQRNILLK